MSERLFQICVWERGSSADDEPSSVMIVNGATVACAVAADFVEAGLACLIFEMEASATIPGRLN